MHCPACRSALKTTRLAGDMPVELDVCPSCHGAWFDMGELTRLDGSVWANMERHPYHEVEGDHPGAVCPKCDRAMYDQREMDFHLEPMSPPDAPDLIVDRCPSCFGFWLDHGELDRIIELADKYDHLKRIQREFDLQIIAVDQAAMAVVRAWPDLSDEARGAIERIAQANPTRKLRRNALGLSDYAEQAPELRFVIDVWYELSNGERAKLLLVLPETSRPKRGGRFKSARGKQERLDQRPADWSWLRWITYRFQLHLADNASDIF